MHPIIVFSALSWIVVASSITIVVTLVRIVFGSLAYADGKYALVIAALGIAAAIEIGDICVRRLTAIVLISLVLATLASPTHASPFIRTGENTLAPMAFVVFCLKYPGDCEAAGAPTERIVLTTERKQELAAVNTHINRTIKPERNLGGLATERWLLYPPTGDCNDYAVTKRHELLARGWPSGTLLIAVVIVPGTGGHAVLVVRTDAGDLVLDSLRGNLTPWDRLPYRWVRIEATDNPRYWKRIQSLAPANAGAFFYLHRPTPSLSPRRNNSGAIEGQADSPWTLFIRR
jgi:predicted transglutaminase-like cysteine proteinase